MLPVQFHKNLFFNKEILQELKITDHFKRYPFADWFVEKTEVNGTSHGEIRQTFTSVDSLTIRIVLLDKWESDYQIHRQRAVNRLAHSGANTQSCTQKLYAVIIYIIKGLINVKWW